MSELLADGGSRIAPFRAKTGGAPVPRDAMPPTRLRGPLRPPHPTIVLETAAASLAPERVGALLARTRVLAGVALHPPATR